MKKTIIILSLFICLKATSQTKADTTFTDSTKFISIIDIRNWLNSIQDKVSYKSYTELLASIQDLVTVSKKDYEEKRKKK